MIDQSKRFGIFVSLHILTMDKSTLADRIIEMTGLLTEREMQAQVLDNMTLRENEESPSNPRRFVLYTKPRTGK